MLAMPTGTWLTDVRSRQWLLDFLSGPEGWAARIQAASSLAAPLCASLSCGDGQAMLVLPPAIFLRRLLGP
ncbi:MAG: hypothetical protein WBX25_20460, partial [Rhodomicrobium sp.]